MDRLIRDLNIREPTHVSVIDVTSPEADATQYGLVNSVDISFFVPCYNEEDNVVGAIEKLVKLAARTGLSYEVLVFDDASSDGTLDVLEAYRMARPDVPLRVYANSINRGVARNFVEGAFRSRGKYYRLVCGDDVEPIESHVALAEHIGEADIIVPYFTEIGGRKLHRHVISRLYTWLVNRVSGRHLRYYNGCPIYRRADVLRYHVEATGFGYQAEFLARLLREQKSFIEVPLVSIDREGSATLNLRNFISVAHSLLKIWLGRLRVYLIK